tara:strand:- start:656 stop:838 length:183 start_codon:yes stop_codon:yes gene_type:complete
MRGFELVDVEYFEQIMNDGAVDVDCTACDYSARIEPDADSPCPECDTGRLVSPLILAGLI